MEESDSETEGSMNHDEDEEMQEEPSTDILDSSVFGHAKLFECVECKQKFTNKLKITLHWAVNHQFKLCNLCSNYAFKYESERIAHHRQHIPFSCSSCEFEFTSVDQETISMHYKEQHKSFCCDYCSSVIEPFEKNIEHIEKKHNFADYVNNSDVNLFDVIGDPETGFFHCNWCNKKKRMNLLFGHYVFYHNLSIKALKDILEKTPNVKINGSTITGTIVNDNDEGSSEVPMENCTVCEKSYSADVAKELHDILCKGFVVCDQKECSQLFENKKSLAKHLDQAHPSSTCKFGCPETSLKPREVSSHLRKLHDIVECYLCNIINSSGNFNNHLRDQHSVNLMTYEKAIGKAKSKLYRVESSTRSKKQVLCNFCDFDLTSDIYEFSFIDHYQYQHEVNITAILRNLDKNPIIVDMIMSETKSKAKNEWKKSFTIVYKNNNKGIQDLVETDFDTSKVYCIGYNDHLEQKPVLMEFHNDNEEEEEPPSRFIACEFCNMTFDVSCLLYEHLSESHGFLLLNVSDKCNTCQVDKSVEIAEKEDSKDFNLSLICPIDGMSMVTKDNFRNHMESEHLDSTMSSDRIIYKCLECNFAYKNLELVRFHFETSHPADVKMKYCRICRFKLNDSQNDHFSLNHSEKLQKIEKFCCKVCKKEFTKKQKATAHYEVCNKAAMKKKFSFKCQMVGCSETYADKEDRKMHMMVAHPNEKLFACKTCPLKFTTKSSLSSHNLIHKNIVNTCEFCQKTFLRRDSYKEHLLIHSGVRQKCSFCVKTFVQRSNLVRHERIHLNDKPYKCSYCEKTFSDKGACTSHEKVHTRSECSNCEVCGKFFARKQKLRYHMRIHTLENILTCDCGKIFTESYSFKKHKETHLKKGRTDACEICNKIFKSLKAKSNHIRNVHPSPDEDPLIKTNIQCMLCGLPDFSVETIKEHLAIVHQSNDPNEWEKYVDEVEFEMDALDDEDYEPE